ncbi:MAG: hypothetical protein LAT50_13710 [Ectothiorhodospiraceae bacterium]|nr:hypothetical protein [Ectothiorhodospiraceae bacterium]
MSRAVVMVGWEDVPHLSAKDQAELERSIPPHQRDARKKGVPSLGAGAIYPVPEEDIKVAPFPIPAHWPRCFGFDVGWNRTAAIWGAIDRESNTVYLYSEHYRGKAEPSVHAASMRKRGVWIPGAIDPAARGRSQKDGEQLYQNYLDLGLDITKADNAREAGIEAVFEALSTGQMKVFSTLEHWLTEYRLYRRDEKGNIVKVDDHLMDATRYLKMTGLRIARSKVQALAAQRGHTAMRQTPDGAGY